MAVQVSSGLLMAVIMVARFLRAPDSEVKRRLNTTHGHNTRQAPSRAQIAKLRGVLNRLRERTGGGQQVLASIEVIQDVVMATPRSAEEIPAVTTDMHAPGIASPTPFDRRKSMSLVGDNGANLARSMRRREVIHQCRPSPIASAGGRCFSLAL